VSRTDRLRALLEAPGLLVMPGCHDAMSARLIEEAGFPLGFMSGFAVSASRLGMPDTGLISYGELADQAQNICRAVSIPMIGDGDTGFGSAQNVKRTVEGYARAGFACIMLEDQVAPKRCGHTEGKAVVARDEALMRIRAAVDARDAGEDILIMARTDARIDGLDLTLTTNGPIGSGRCEGMGNPSLASLRASRRRSSGAAMAETGVMGFDMVNLRVAQ